MRALRTSCLMILWVVGVAVGCSGRQPTSTEAPPPGLIVLPGAQNIRHSSDYQGVLQYDVEVPFPAEHVVRSVSDSLTAAGWRQITPRRQYSGPGHPTPHELGWATIFEGPTRVLTWTAAWSNGAPNGNGRAWRASSRPIIPAPPKVCVKDSMKR